MHNTLANRERINYDPYSPNEQKAQMEAAKKFLVGQGEELEFDSVRQAKELSYQIRHIYQKVKSLNKGKPQSQELPEKMQKPKIEEKPEEKKEEKDDKKNKKNDKNKDKDKKRKKKKKKKKKKMRKKKKKKSKKKKKKNHKKNNPLRC